jgi:hypothetical protein
VALSELEQDFLRACRIAKRAIEYEGDDRTAFRGAAFEALTKVIAKAEAKDLASSLVTKAD